MSEAHEALLQRLSVCREKNERLRITNYELRQRNQSQKQKLAELDRKIKEMKSGR